MEPPKDVRDLLFYNDTLLFYNDTIFCITNIELTMNVNSNGIQLKKKVKHNQTFKKIKQILTGKTVQI